MKKYTRIFHWFKGQKTIGGLYPRIENLSHAGTGKARNRKAI